jgi:hypothetical protein
MFNSWLPTGYFASWVFNFLIFFIELFAWMARDDFLVVWIYVGTWGGLVFGMFPVGCMLIYIFSEWPIRQSNSNWEYIFWSSEFFMIFMQGLLALTSWILHLVV